MYCKPSISFSETGGRVSIMVGPKNCGDKVVEDVEIVVPLPACVSTHHLEPTVGHTKYDDRTKTLRWFISKLPKDKVPMLEGSQIRRAHV